jgi:hypothetical protein
MATTSCPVVAIPEVLFPVVAQLEGGLGLINMKKSGYILPS